MSSINPADLTVAEKNAYMKALLSIAAADDNIAPPELERIKAAAKRFGCRLKASDLKTFSLDGIARGISRPHVQKAALAEIIDIAKADRKLSSDELQVIKYLCSQWGLPLPDLGVGWEQVRSPGDKKSVEELESRTRSGIVTSKLRAINATSQGFSVKWVVGSLIIMALLMALSAIAIDQGLRRGHIQSGAQTRNAFLIGLGLTFFLGGFIVGIKSAGRTVLEPAVAAGLGVAGGLYVLTLKNPTFQDLKGDIPTLVIFVAVPFFVALIGGWVGELIQRSTLRFLHGRPEMTFLKSGPGFRFDATGFTLLAIDAPPISRADAGRPLLLLDSTWRWLPQLMACLTGAPIARSMPNGLRTAYPRTSKVFDDPEAGLASIEALYVARRLLGDDDPNLLDGYHWKHAFLHNVRASEASEG